MEPGSWILQDPNVRYAKIDKDIMKYRCPTCKDVHQHGAQGEKLYNPTLRVSHCPKEDFKQIKIIPI